MLESQHSQQRFFPGMGGMYRQQMFAPNMFYGFPPNVYPYVQRQMFPRQTQYQRSYHNRPGQGRRLNKQQGQMQQQAQMQMQMQQQAQIQQQQAQPAPAQPAPAASEGAEKQRIGEAIYTRIMPMFPGDQNLWGKLTGMLLESIELPVLQTLINDEAALTEKINQAKEYYDQHMEQASQ